MTLTVAKAMSWIAILAMTESCNGHGTSDSLGAMRATASADTATAAGTSVVWNFDGMPVGQPPPGFLLERTGPGNNGRWIIRAVSDARSQPNVLAQEDTDRTAGRFAVAAADSTSFGDVSLSVRCKPLDGRVDQACGIVWRYRDHNNYYLARANALENDVRFYVVQDGRRREIEGWNGAVATGVWHELRADVRLDRAEIYFDGVKVIDARNGRLTAPGKIGMWIKADSHTLFDDLAAIPLVSR